MQVHQTFQCLFNNNILQKHRVRVTTDALEPFGQ